MHAITTATRFWRRREGSALIEAALALPLMLLMLAAAMDFSRMFYTAMAVSNAATAGARYGASEVVRNTNYSGMQNAAVADSGISGLTATAAAFCACSSAPSTSVSCTSSCASGTLRKYIRVETSSTFTTFAAWPFIPRSTLIKGRASVRIQ